MLAAVVETLSQPLLLQGLTIRPVDLVIILLQHNLALFHVQEDWQYPDKPELQQHQQLPTRRDPPCDCRALKMHLITRL